MNSSFFKQVKLLVEILPHVAKEECFVLKGGTAINLFVRDLPRLSVDIDLAYLPIQDRNQSLEAIDKAMRRVKEHIKSTLRGSDVSETLLSGTDKCIRLRVKREDVQVKIEITPVLRGSIHAAVIQSLSPKTIDTFGSSEMQLLSFEDLYGGKLCAALDRQHPRDLFDVYYLLENEGISTKLKDTFLVYLLSHPRPIAELLDPHLKDIEGLYKSEFEGMTIDELPLETLLSTRIKMIQTIHALLTDKDKEFLLSIKEGNGKWDLFAYPEAANLPAVKWKIQNLTKLSKVKRKVAYDKLKNVLNNGPQL